jgi:hypothetical protein
MLSPPARLRQGTVRDGCPRRLEDITVPESDGLSVVPRTTVWNPIDIINHATSSTNHSSSEDALNDTELNRKPTMPIYHRVRRKSSAVTPLVMAAFPEPTWMDMRNLHRHAVASCMFCTRRCGLQSNVVWINRRSKSVREKPIFTCAPGPSTSQTSVQL